MRRSGCRSPRVITASAGAVGRHGRGIGGGRASLALKLVLELGVFGRDCVDRRLAVGAHRLVLGFQRGKFGFHLGTHDRPFLEGLLLARDRTQLIAVDGGKFALRQVAIDQACGLDRLGFAFSVSLFRMIAAEDDPAGASEDHGCDPGEQHPLALGGALIELPGADRLMDLAGLLLTALGVFECLISHDLAPRSGRRDRPWCWHRARVWPARSTPRARLRSRLGTIYLSLMMTRALL